MDDILSYTYIKRYKGIEIAGENLIVDRSMVSQLGRKTVRQIDEQLARQLHRHLVDRWRDEMMNEYLARKIYRQLGSKMTSKKIDDRQTVSQIGRQMETQIVRQTV